MTRKTLRIGVYSVTLRDVMDRPIGGAIRFARQQGDILIRDCRIPFYDAGSHPPSPPWAGHVDGIILEVGLSKDETAEEVVQWVERGGVPAVNIAAGVLHPRLPNRLRGCGLDRPIGGQPSPRLRLSEVHACGLRPFDGIAAACRGFRQDPRSAGPGSRAVRFYGPRRRGQQRWRSGGGCPPPRPLAGGAAAPAGRIGSRRSLSRAVWRVCQSLGLRVPQQVAIIGVDDTPVAFAQRPGSRALPTPATKSAIARRLSW